MNLEMVHVLLSSGTLVALIIGLIKVGKLLERIEAHDRALRKAGWIPFVVMAGVFFQGCAMRQPDLGQPVITPDYGYMKVGEQYHVVVRNPHAMRQLEAEICRWHVCSWNLVGDVYLVDVTP